jgi:hypothetical protein
LLDEIAQKHNKSANAFIRTQHPLLIFVLGYQDGLIHSLQRILRMRKTGGYHSVDAVHARLHGYDNKIATCVRNKDFWNAAYAQGYQNGLMFLLLRSESKRAPKPSSYDALLDVKFGSLEKLLRFPKNRLPKPMAAQANRMLKRLPKEAKLIPDHTPFL